MKRLNLVMLVAVMSGSSVVYAGSEYYSGIMQSVSSGSNFGSVTHDGLNTSGGNNPTLPPVEAAKSAGTAGVALTVATTERNRIISEALTGTHSRVGTATTATQANAASTTERNWINATARSRFRVE
ncbi:hypothetical protein A6E01_20155 (plasmid) [Vibrio breoganii]|uniref:Uncharacterized protein n=1 Tax=Vibrio breoganii TaxID=553239 RepID=A0AAN0XZT0_9VIBR|nr:hypothetical protein [Vibrio breoganii]ANO35528.1 hypothetical protein A6E01_20155 [Vibrio breoganii]